MRTGGEECEVALQITPHLDLSAAGQNKEQYRKHLGTWSRRTLKRLMTYAGARVGLMRRLPPHEAGLGV